MFFYWAFISHQSTRSRRQVNYTEDNAELNNELLVPDKPTDETALEHDKVSMKDTTFRNDADSFNQDKMSQDYLLSGGGFCLEGNDTQEEEHSFEQNDGSQ